MSSRDESDDDFYQGALLGAGGLAAEPRPGGGEHGATEAPRVVTTGRKLEPEGAEEASTLPTDPETGEPFKVYGTGGHGIKIVRQLVAKDKAPHEVALIDALAFTVVPPDDEGVRWLLQEMGQFLPIESPKDGRGCFGFKHSMRFGGGAGLVAWGGKSQRDRVYFSIQGKGCGMVEDWAAVSTWLTDHRATIKRVDVAHDDPAGAIVSIAWAVAQYEAGGFNAGGRKPKHQVHGDWIGEDSGVQGRTFGVGNRASGKYCRIYEKGKQLGDPTSPWVRLEVEWRGQDRQIPHDVLTRPGQYLAGAYPCLAFLDQEQSRIRTIARGSTIAFERAVENARLHSGKLVHLMLQVYGGDYATVVEKLRREGTPARIDPFSYHLRGKPEQLDPDAPGSFAQLLADK